MLMLHIVQKKTIDYLKGDKVSFLLKIISDDYALNRKLISILYRSRENSIVKRFLRVMINCKIRDEANLIINYTRETH